MRGFSFLGSSHDQCTSFLFEFPKENEGNYIKAKFHNSEMHAHACIVIQVDENYGILFNENCW